MSDCILSSFSFSIALNNINYKIEVSINSKIEDIEQNIISIFDIPIQQRLHYQVLSSNKNNDLNHAFLTLKCNDSLLGLLCWQHSVFSSNNFATFSNSKILNLLFKAMIPLLQFRFGVLGNLLAENGEGIFINPNTTYTKNEIEHIIHELLVTLQKKLAYSMVIIKDAGNYTFERFGYTFRDNDVSMAMTLPKNWISITDYEKALTHKYAQRFRKIQKQMQQWQVESLSVEGLKDNAEVIFSLYKQVLSRQSIKLANAQLSYFSHLKKTFDNQFEIKIIRNGNTIIGFYSYFKNSDSLETHFIGMDYSITANQPLYFAILFYYLQDAIQDGIKYIEFGRTAMEAKAIVGAEVIYHNTYFKVYGKIKEKIVYKFANDYIKNLGEGWRNRHPFKVSINQIEK